MFTDSDERKIADCIVNKLKNKYPKGFDGRNNDSVEKQTELLSEDCLKGMVLHFTWSERFINKVQQNAGKASWLKLVSEKDKDKYCTCYINRLKQMHPNGIVDSLRQADVDSAFDFCKQGIVKR